MWFWKILEWVTGGGATALGGVFLKFYQAKLGAEATVEKQTADLTSRSLELDAREADVQGKIITLEQGNPFTRWVRPMWAAPYVLITWKVVVWDNMLQDWTHGNTDPISPWFAGLGMIIATAYFGGRAYEIGERVKTLRASISGK